MKADDGERVNANGKGESLKEFVLVGSLYDGIQQGA